MRDLLTPELAHSTFKRSRPCWAMHWYTAVIIALCVAGSAQAAQTINTSSTTSCSAKGGVLSGGNILTDFDNGTFGSENGQPDQSPSTNPYPGQIDGGVFTNFYSFFHGAYGYVANAVTPRNSFQHPDITDPVYGVTGRFFASDPNVDTPIINFTALNVLPNANYELSFWAANSEPNGAPNDINLEIDGIVSLNTGPLQAFPSALEWRKYAFVFNTGNRTEILIALRSLETGAGGRDFYLDNVEMQLCNVSGGAITGTTYADINQDNFYQPLLEAGLQNIDIELYDTRGDADPSNDILAGLTSTGVDGFYAFSDLPINTFYEIRAAPADPDLPPGSSPGTSSSRSVNMTSSSTAADNDFGYDQSAPAYSISKTSKVHDDTRFSGFAVPEQDMEYELVIENNGGEGADLNSIFVVDQLPSELTFFNGDFDGAGAETDPVLFSGSGSGLDFDYGRDVAYSNSTSPPASFSDCSYTPAIGYDPDIRYICINPKGVMAGGTNPPRFTVRFRARLN